MADVLWYYEEAGKPAGPVSEAALAEAIRLGRLTRGQRVWTAGQAGWLAWDAVPVLAALAPLPAPPPPPLTTTTATSAPPASAGGWGTPASSAPAPVPPGTGWSPPPAPAAPTALAPAGTYPRAPLWPRFLATIVDGVIGSGPMMIALGLFALSSGDILDAKPSAAPLAALVVAGLLWALWYGFTKDGRAGGQSIGKRMMQLMVVHLPTNQPCTTGQSALRAMVQIVLQLVPYVGWLVEPIAVLVAPDGRRLGDKAAGTQVILASDWRQRR